MKFCDICCACLNGTRQVIQHDPDVTFLRHHESELDLWRAAEDGCSFCAAFTQTIKRETPDTMLNLPKLESLFASENNVYSQHAYMLFSVQRANEHDCDTSVALMRNDQGPRSVLGPDIEESYKQGPFKVLPCTAKEINQFMSLPKKTEILSTGSEAVLSLASKWLASCQSHPTCRKSCLTFTPTRLLDVDIPGNDSSFRVVNTAESNTCNASYLTLSHRWGTADFIKLKLGNLHELQQPQDIALLPRTFRDAVTVCRHLNVRYLWIDSLCIVQDDSDDWSKQAPQMSAIYGHGKCNISATEVKDVHQGLFAIRDPILVMPILYDLPATSLLNLPVGVKSFIKIDDHGQRLTSAPLNQRGWVFQERLLSRAVPHFLDDKVMWECAEIPVATEIYNFGLPSDLCTFSDIDKQLLFDFEVQYGSQQGMAEPDANSSCGFCISWARLVAQFTLCALTYLDDRPWAIAGLALRIGQLSGQTYHSGVWQEHIHSQLCWHAGFTSYHRKSPVSDKPAKRHLPSFSWLSLDCEIVMEPLCERSQIFKVLDMDVGPLELVDGVTQQSGRIKVQCLLRSIRIAREHDRRRANRHWKLARPTNQNFDDNLTQFEELPKAARGTPDLTRRDLPSSADQKTLYVTPLGWSDSAYEPMEYWLILEVVDAQEITYRRVGMLDFEDFPAEEEVRTRARELVLEYHKVDGFAPGVKCGTGDERIFFLV